MAAGASGSGADRSIEVRQKAAKDAKNAPGHLTAEYAEHAEYRGQGLRRFRVIRVIRG